VLEAPESVWKGEGRVFFFLAWVTGFLVGPVFEVQLLGLPFLVFVKELYLREELVSSSLLAKGRV
jgi:hypothetical protein